MSLWAMILVVVSALLHAGWNVLSKRTQASGPAFFLSSSAAAAALLTPYVVWYLSQVGVAAIPMLFWVLLILSGIAQMIYLVGLSMAYQSSDIGMVYPIARALPVLMVGAGTVVLGYELSSSSWSGFVLMTVGCLFVPLTSFKQFRVTEYLNIGVLWAFIAALGTTGYALLDKEALIVLGQTFSWLVSDTKSAIFYLGLQFWAIALSIGAYSLVAERRGDFRQAWAFKKTSSVAGIMMASTYGLVLTAMTMTDNVSLVVALRQISIIFGLIFGMIWLAESAYVTRIVGAVLIVIGLVLTTF
ncbi:EamA family transporter [Vibrio ostreicida]|uniref:EamA family transporter n=1 Tax=Vibrio ostreicida TaxID=526588 RepID=UPI0009707359|nr:EamA family transporter [Vibrio ostreicida]